VGDGDQNPVFRNTLQTLIIQEGLEDRVRLVGLCEDMPAAMLASDVVVSASSTQPEAFGRVAVEAQAMGRPVVATAHGGSLETVLDRKTGWLVKPADVHALSEALAEAVQDRKKRERFGRYGFRWVRERFTVRRMCEETLHLYQELVSAKEATV
jgi:glycosyltransferase involved in cell wall biosynthesis